MSVILRPLDPSALRRYGAWAEEPYDYGHNGQEPIAVKRFLWHGKAITIENEREIKLTYYSDAVVEAKRMNDLGYLAERERSALDQVEAMVLAATNGVAYLGLPHPAQAVTNDVLKLIGGWVKDGGYPPTWAEDAARTIGQQFQQMEQYAEFLRSVGAKPDPEHTSWGLAVMINPIEPREEK